MKPPQTHMKNPSTNRRQSLKLLLMGLLGLGTQKALGKETEIQAISPIPWTDIESMKIAYILFDKITVLDFIGIYDPLSRIKSKGYMEDFSWDLCAMKGVVKDSFGLTMKVDKIAPNLADYDMVIVPGGFGTRPLQTNNEFLAWLKTAEEVTYKVSICTGSLLLGAAGFLKDKVVTTNFKEYETVEKYCKTVSKDRIVEDGNVITAGAVASSLDMGLYLCEKLVGKENTEEIRKSMDYYPSDYRILQAE